jgi:hypothetical protein
MKKIFLLIGLLITINCYAQNTTTSPQISTKAIYRTATINVTKDSIVSKDTVKALKEETVKKDSVVKAQNDTIKKQTDQIESFKTYFKNQLWNGLNPFVFYTAFIFGFIGLIFMWLCKTYFGASTDEYKWKVAFSSKNIVLHFIGLILAILTIYLTLYVFPVVGETSIITNLYALVIGAGWQTYAKKLMKWFESKAKADSEAVVTPNTNNSTPVK